MNMPHSLAVHESTTISTAKEFLPPLNPMARPAIPAQGRGHEPTDSSRTYHQVAAKRRSVTFESPQQQESSVVCEVPSLSDMSSQEREAIWTPREDYENFRSTAKSIAISIREGHELCEQDRASYTHVVKRIHSQYIQSSEPHPEELELLNEWVSVGHSRRGLELLCVPGMAKDRERRRARIVREVMKAHFNLNKMVECRPEQRMEAIRYVSERLSRPAKKFAVALAQADEFAVRKEMQKQTGERTTKMNPAA